jgi:hypothetical protein
MLAAREFAPESMIPKSGCRFSEQDHAPPMKWSEMTFEESHLARGATAE